jgi:hypothetical protein
VDETGVKLTYTSRNQKLLAVKGSKKVHSDAQEKGDKPWQNLAA